MDTLPRTVNRAGTGPAVSVGRPRRAAAALIAALTCTAVVGGALLLQAQQPGPPASTGAQQPAAACSWQLRDADPASPTDATYRATCDGVGVLDAAIEDGELLTGTLAGRPLSLALEPGSDPAMFDVSWRGSFDGVPVALHVVDNAVVAGSSIGAGTVTCTGPSLLSADWSWLESDGYPMPVSFAGDPAVTGAEVSAICNLVTVGLPASGFGLAKGLLERPAEI